MSDASALGKESVKSLGAGAYLVTVLPSAVLVLVVFALAASGLYPGDAPPTNVSAGPAAVIYNAQRLKFGGTIVLLLAVLVVAVLLRPFQLAMVQLLEGYWSNRGPGFVESVAIERHRRRMRRYQVREHPDEWSATTTTFADVAAFARRDRAAARMKARAQAALENYPRNPDFLMPTSLGNVLRRAETTAGERYGLGTVVTYPRLYPYLSPRLDAEVSEQLDVLDASATFTLLLWALAALSAPLVLRHDRWSAAPFVFAALAAITYRGARAAARRYGTMLATSYDLHRFDMLAALRLQLPEDAKEESESNERLTVALLEERVWKDLSPRVRYRRSLASETTASAKSERTPEPTPDSRDRLGADRPSATNDDDLPTDAEDVHDDGE